jgi:protein tyrosine phosphatase
MMIIQQNCGVIVALNRQIENKVVKGERYWPEKDRKLTLGDLTLKLISHLHIKPLDITIRKIKLSYQTHTREIYHLHYEGWPDFGVPDSSLGIRELLRLSQYYHSTPSSPTLTGPIVVHCSAGIGRSGSFLTIASIMCNPLFKQIQRDYPSPTPADIGRLLQTLSSQFNISNTVLSLRKQRHPGMVQTPQQYKFIYSTLMDEIYQHTIVSDAICRVIQWEKVKTTKKAKFLSRSGPVRKSYDKDGDYDGFLVNHTSNDLCHIFRKKDMKRKVGKGCLLGVSDTTQLSCKEDRSFFV